MGAYGKVSRSCHTKHRRLHQKAGSKEVLELHGSVLRNYCMRCRKPYDVRDIAAGTGVPKCTCGGIIKPDVVLYEESLGQLHDQ